jgi:hypothetical protein
MEMAALVVVFPTPPLPEVTTMILATKTLLVLETLRSERLDDEGVILQIDLHELSLQ